MGYTLQSSYDTVQVLSSTSAIDALFCTIVTSGSGSIVNRTLPKSAFDAGGGSGALESLATAVDEAISGGLAIFAVGTQGVDDAGLIFDAVTFTVEYTPPSGSLGPITTTVEIPVDVLTADTQFGGALATYFGGSGQQSPQQTLRDAYDRLAAMASG